MIFRMVTITLFVAFLSTALGCHSTDRSKPMGGSGGPSPVGNSASQKKLATNPTQTTVVKPISITAGIQAVDFPLSVAVRMDLWNRISKQGRINLSGTGEPFSWAGANFAVCGNHEELVIDFTKVSFVPFKAGGVQFLNNNGDVIGSAVLSTFEFRTTRSGYASHILTFTDVKLEKMLKTFTLSQLDGNGSWLYASTDMEISDCKFFGNRTYADIRGKKAIQVPTLARSNVSSAKTVWGDLFPTEFSYGFLKGVLNGQTIGSCSFTFNNDDTGILKAMSTSNKANACELSPGQVIDRAGDLIVDIYRDGVHVFKTRSLIP